MHTAADAHMVPAGQAPEAAQAGSCGQDLPVHPFLLAEKEVKKIYFPKPFQKPDSHTGYR